MQYFKKHKRLKFDDSKFPHKDQMSNTVSTRKSIPYLSLSV